MNTIQTVCLLLIVCGCGMITYATIIYIRHLRDIAAKYNPTFGARLLKILVLILMIIFIGGYIVGAVDMLMLQADPIYYFVSVIFFFGGIFVLLMIKNLISTAKSLVEKTEQLQNVMRQIEEQNISLRTEVDFQLREILRHDHLLHTVNETATILLGSDAYDFDSALWKCLSLLAQTVDVDRMYIWKNSIKDNELYCTQLYEWSGGAEPQQGNDLTVDVLFPEDWYENLSINKCVNGLVRNFPKREREHLTAQGILSILVLPVYIQDQFWGFVGFDDCHNEHIFSESEERILRSASLLIATALLRNDTTQNLVQAREDAIFSSKVKSDFLSNMSHEIRTPINAITGMIAIAQKTDDAAKIRDSLGKIGIASNQLLSIINDILDMSKIEVGKLELACVPFDLHATLYNVRSIIGISATSKHQEFRLDIEQNVPRFVLGDDTRLSQILINLLSNAVKFTPDKGKVTLSLRLIGQNDNLYNLEAQVRDNGVGISKEDQARLFRAFEQADNRISRNYGGTGLGLSISKQLAKLMCGDIAVDSEPGKGSCFTATFQLEANTKQISMEVAAVVDSDHDFTGLTALLAEDIAINREIVLALLEGSGLVIDCAENGQEALVMFQNKAVHYDIVFMDVQMPVLDGFKATQLIRALDLPYAKTVPIVAMTANAFSEDVLRCLEAGMNDHISKPINIERVYGIIEKYAKHGQK